MGSRAQDSACLFRGTDSQWFRFVSCLFKHSRYPELIKPLIEATPTDHPDRHSLINLLEKVNSAYADVNAIVARKLSEAKIKELTNKLKDIPANLLTPDNYVILERSVEVSVDGKEKKPHYAVLISDKIILATPRKSDKFDVKFVIDLDCAIVHSLPDDDATSTFLNNYRKNSVYHVVRWFDGCAFELLYLTFIFLVLRLVQSFMPSV
jgi:predicted nucleic acid-binding protein